MLVKIYRLEKDGLGPYQNDWKGKYRLSNSHSDSTTHPTWYNDGLTEELWSTESSRPYKSGFKSLDDLHTWFAGHLNMLLKKGFAIKSFYINSENIKYGDSNKQLAFKP